MIYLASPYSHPDHAVREQRFQEACRAAAKLIRLGYAVFSPIAHSHPICQHGCPGDWDSWEAFDQELLSHCDEVVVLAIDGWRESVGVQAEIRLAAKLGKPVRYLQPDCSLAEQGSFVAHPRHLPHTHRPRPADGDGKKPPATTAAG